MSPENSGGAPTPSVLPPEVEAELRRRVQGQGPASPAPAVVAAPTPVEEAPAAPAQPAAGPDWQEKLKRFGPLGALLVLLLGKAKFLLFALKFLLPVLKTGGTMLLSIVVYAQVFGWWFAAGFVLSILVHEMGHVYVAWRMGVPVTAPIFIPGFGALILQKRAARSAWDEALIGIGGPVAGTLAALLCLLLYQLTRSPLMLALAHTGFFINLFNLAPLYPLDGGWITGAVSPRIWLIGIIGMVALYVTGTIGNPLILLLVILSLPRLLHGLKTGDMMHAGAVPTTPHQRVVMGVSYVSLCALLFWLMTSTQRPV